MEIRDEDLHIEVIRPPTIQGLHIYPGDEETVRVTHLPTGLTAIASSRSQLQAKAIALADIYALLNCHEGREDDEPSR